MIRNFISIVKDIVSVLFDINMLPITLPLLIIIVGGGFTLYYSYSSGQELSEKEARLSKEYKYKVTQSAGDCRNTTFVFFTNSYEPVGCGIKFVDEEKKETFISGNFNVQPTK